MKIAIISGGELAERLSKLLSADTVVAIGVHIRRRYGLAYLLRDPAQAANQLQHADIIINLLPTGEDFLGCGIIDMMPQSATVIDFSRPPIPPASIGRKIIMSNRLRHPSLRFWPPLPGWRADELPACSLPCILASTGDLSAAKNDHDFNVIARYVGFSPKITGR